MAAGGAITLYTGSDQTGSSLTIAVEDDKRYHALDFDDLRDAGIALNVNSIYIVADETSTSLVLFNEYDLATIIYYRPFSGTFLQYTNGVPSWPSSWQPVSQGANLPDNWTDKATSLFAVRRSEYEYIYSFSELLELAKANGILDIDEVIASAAKEAERESDGDVKELRVTGDLTIWGEFFPTGNDLNNSHAYVALKLPLELDLASLAKTFTAYVTIYIGFDVLKAGDNGVLIASVEGWDVWVESGGRHDKVETGLRAAVGELSIDLNSALREIGQNSPLSEINFSDVYLLPGNRDSWIGTGAFGSKTGAVTGDVVLVGVTNDEPPLRRPPMEDFEPPR